MAAKDVKFQIKIGVDGADKIEALAAPVKEFESNIQAAEAKAKSLSTTLLNFSNLTTILDSLSQKISSISAAINEAQQAKMVAAQMTGLDGRDLDQVRAKAKALADTYGTDYREAMMAANNLSKAFGITAQQALQLVQDGFTAGANANGEFIDTLREYPRYFQEAGISAQQFIAITANAAQQGIYSDKGVDTIKEGNLRIREMTTATADALNAIGISAEAVQQQLRDGTTTTFQVMQQVGAKLAELPASSAQVGTAIADIFGGPGEDAGLEYIKSLATINTNLQQLTAQADNTSKAMANQANAQTTINNGLLKFNDLLANLAPVQPLLNFAAQAGMAALAITTLTKTLASYNIIQKATAAATITINAAKRAAIAIYNSARTAIVAYTIASQTMTAAELAATIATNLLKTAIRGLLIATGVGAAVVALTMAVEALIGACTSATSSAEDLAASSDTLASKAERARQAEAQMTTTLNQQRTQLTTTIAQLRNFNGTKDDEKKKVQELNATYGTAMGYYSTVAQWYKALVNNSRAYCEQLIYEARVKKYASQIAENEEEKRRIIYNDDGTKRTYDNSREEVRRYNKNGKYIDTAGDTYDRVYKTTDLDKANAKVKQLNAETANLRKLMQEAASKSANIQFKQFEGYSATDNTNNATAATNKATTNKTTTHTAATQEKTEEQKIDEQINRLTQEYIQATAERRTQIQKELADLRQRRTIIQQTTAEASRPTATNWTDADYAAEINYLKKQREALAINTKEYTNLTQQINQLTDQQQQLQHTTQPLPPVDTTTITTYHQLNDALAIYNEQLQRGDAATRQFAQQQINTLNQIKKQWDNTLEAANQPAPVTQLNTLQQLDEALQYYQNQQKNATAAEITNIQQTIQTLQKKHDALTALTHIPEMQDEIGSLDRLTGKKLKMQLEVIGIDTLKDRIQEIQKLLNDTQNPLDTTQRKELSKLVESYTNYEKQAQKSGLSTRKAWSNVKSIGNGIESLTDTINGNGNAWEKITASVDAAIEIYDGIMSVISIIQTLTAVTAAATTAEAASEAASTAATTAKTAAAPAEVTAAATTTAALKVEAMAYRELAASEFMAAHAYIPFAGAGIAAGYIATMQSLVAAVAVTPFANGGLVYGPTLALMGEYSGAANNPEVIAPLDKLRSLIGNTPANSRATIQGRVKGRDLILTIANETRTNRRRTNIRI